MPILRWFVGVVAEKSQNQGYGQRAPAPNNTHSNSAIEKRAALGIDKVDSILITWNQFLP